ncbi:MAG: hypothetical protein HY401_04035 [Elusimicrobia bacterium]|nr:hypothetical protein [Elusimicrobiota bacterium]
MMKTSAEGGKEFPLIKEVNADRILRALILFGQTPLNRDSQRDAILSLYSDKEEKSVFRGMVIPSFRKLGFLQGWEDMISLSANGLLIAEAGGISHDFGMRALRAVLLEKDREYLSVVEAQVHGETTTADLFAKLGSKIAAPSEIQGKERLKRWVALLAESGLMKRAGEKISIEESVLKVAQTDLDSKGKSHGFLELIFQTYREIVREQRQVDVVDIADLRCRVAVHYCKKTSILTERQFDELLRTIPITTEQYLISFGKPMGPEEQLFELNGRYYRTLSVRVLGR